MTTITPSERANLQQAVLAACAQATSQQPIPAPKIILAVQGKLMGTGQDLIFDAIEYLRDVAALNHCRITRNGATQDVYWPTGVPPNAIRIRDLPIGRHTSADAARAHQQHQEAAMAKPAAPDTQSQTDRIIQVILQHGPITGAEVASRAKVRARDLNALLTGPIKKGRIAVRIARAAQAGNKKPLKHYMSPDVAQEWDASQTEPAAQNTDAKQAAPGAETNEPEQRMLALLAERDSLLQLLGASDISAAGETIGNLHRRVHDLTNDAAGMRMILEAMARRLGVDSIEQAPEALERLQATGPHAPASQHHGRLAMLLIDSADQTEIEDLDCADTPSAQARAMASIDQGHAARAVVVRILGEAQRRAEWREAA